VSNNHAKMPASQRAKQFMPFDALTGLRQALKEKEKEKTRVKRKTVCEDKAEQINRTLCLLEVGDFANIVFYHAPEAEYVRLSGRVDFLDKTRCFLKIGSNTVYFNDIFEISV